MREIDKARNTRPNHSSSGGTVFIKKRCNRNNRHNTKRALHKGEEVTKNRPKATAWDIT